MKNFFKFFALAAFALVAGVSCQGGGNEDNDAPELIVGEFAEVAATGGSYAITYQVANPIATDKGVEAFIPVDAFWVHDIHVTDSAVEFVIDANEGVARETTMTLTYPTAASVEVVISQAKGKGLKATAPAIVAAEGGNVSFAYSVIAVEGATLTATVAEATTWIHDINVTAAAVEFVVDANTATEAREAEMTLTYADETITVAIKQAGAVPAEPAFEVKFSNATPTTANVTITPKDPNITYLFKNITSTTLNSYAGETLEEKAAAWAIYQAGTWLFPFWGTATMTNFTSGNYPAEGVSNSLSWTLYNEDEVPYMVVCGINVGEATDKASVALTTAVTIVEAPLMPKPVLTLATDTIEVSSDAGSNGTTFSVANAIDGIKATASTSTSWIKNINIVNDKIAFEYEQNPYAAPREGTITFSYQYADVARKLTVKQAGNPEAEQHKFYFTIKERHYDHVIVDINPSNPNVKYVVGGISKYTFNGSSYNNDPAKIISNTITSYSKVIKTGVQNEFKISVSSVSDSNGWDAYVYAYAIDDTEKVAISDISMEAVTLVNDKPGISWVCEDENTSIATDFYGNPALQVAPTAGSYTIKYTPNNLSDKGLLIVEASSSSYTIIDKSSIVLDTEAKTIKFNTTANEGTSTKTDYIYLKYYSDPNNTTFTDLNVSIKIQQPKQ